MENINRFRGALFGPACGDALGTTVELKPRGSFSPVTDIDGGGPTVSSRASIPTTRRWRFVWRRAKSNAADSMWKIRYSATNCAQAKSA